jgi:hypothetical protein
MTHSADGPSTLPANAITATEFCRRVGFHRSTLSRYLDRGELVPLATIPGSGMLLLDSGDVRRVKRLVAAGRKRKGKRRATKP